MSSGAVLGTVIADYLDEPNIRDSAERAAWLGNDETHYLRRWEEQDIQDLKDDLQRALQ